MSAEQLRNTIEKLQEELNALTAAGSDLTNQRILKLSTRLDDLIVQYTRLVS